MKWKYHRPLDRDYFLRLSVANKFRDTFLFEKFVLDFEMHYHIIPRIDMVVRGGMGAQLYATKDEQRMSEDIDVLTAMPKDEVAKIMQDIDDSLDEVKFTLTRSSPRIRGNLLQYDIKCPSPHRPACRVYMDFLCGVDPRIMQYAHVLQSPTVASLKLGHNIPVLSRGALIADKMCTMSSPETIGLRHLHDFPKQMFDMSALIRGSTLEDMRTLFPAHLHIIGFMSRIYDKYHPVHKIINGAPETCAKLLDFGADSLIAPEYERVYGKFRSRFVQHGLGATPFFQMSEILLVTLCSAHLREYAADADLEGHARRLYASIAKYNRLVREGGTSAMADPETLGRLGALRETLESRPVLLAPAQWHLLGEALGDGRVRLGG
ncbi:MAG: nucleotidyl transferase AbiEii/AbiGii toxin family protein [Thaumarchaeota archaeon]|nr:nucleotidyl transferase AbiEii/AbiGii toxin family protein [Nitrososphaerota archaeon]